MVSIAIRTTVPGPTVTQRRAPSGRGGVGTLAGPDGVEGDGGDDQRHEDSDQERAGGLGDDHVLRRFRHGMNLL